MLRDTSRARLVGALCVAVIAIGACGVIAGAGVTVGNGAVLLVTCLVPPAVMLLVWRGAPPATVAELLYAVDRSSKDVRP